MTTLTVGDLELEVRRSGRRKTVQITVDRGGELVISAPEDCPASTMEDFVREKRFWIYTKLAEKALLDQPVGGKRFVSGEGFPYLGRSYRLLLVDEQAVPLKLERGRFRLRRAAGLRAPQGVAGAAGWVASGALTVRPVGGRARDLYRARDIQPFQGWEMGLPPTQGGAGLPWALKYYPVGVEESAMALARHLPELSPHSS